MANLKKQARQAQIDAARTQTRLAQENARIQRQQFEQIQPLVTALLSLGIDPSKFLQSPFGQSLFGPAIESIGQQFDASRVNLSEALASRGISGTGVGAAPLASTFIDQAKASADLFRTIPQVGLNLGIQGANIAQGQQAIFNPAPLFGVGNQGFTSVINAPTNELLKSVIGAGGQAVGGLASAFRGGG